MRLPELVTPHHPRAVRLFLAHANAGALPVGTTVITGSAFLEY